MDEKCFVCGQKNERGMKLVFTPGPDRASAEYVMPEYFQGYTGVVHGGIVSTLLDEAMAKACLFAGYNAYTVDLNVKYKKALPVGTHVTVTAEISEKRHKLIRAKAELRSENTLFATAEAKFFEF